MNAQVSPDPCQESPSQGEIWVQKNIPFWCLNWNWGWQITWRLNPGSLLITGVFSWHGCFMTERNDWHLVSYLQVAVSFQVLRVRPSYRFEPLVPIVVGIADGFSDTIQILVHITGCDDLNAWHVLKCSHEGFLIHCTSTCTRYAVKMIKYNTKREQETILAVLMLCQYIFMKIIGTWLTTSKLQSFEKPKVSW